MRLSGQTDRAASLIYHVRSFYYESQNFLIGYRSRIIADCAGAGRFISGWRTEPTVVRGLFRRCFHRTDFNIVPLYLSVSAQKKISATCF